MKEEWSLLLDIFPMNTLLKALLEEKQKSNAPQGAMLPGIRQREREVHRFP